jgi:glyoxylase I family protein
MSIDLQGICPLLMVFDMPESLAFYRDILGFEVISDSGKGDESGWVWLRLNDSELMLNTQYDEGERPAERDEIRDKNHGDTIIYFGCPNVDKAYKTLIDKGLQVSPPEITGYGFNSITFNDPDGYAICFHWKSS